MGSSCTALYHPDKRPQFINAVVTGNHQKLANLVSRRADVNMRNMGIWEYCSDRSCKERLLQERRCLAERMS